MIEAKPSPKPYRIVVGYDYSPIAELALGRALELASREEQGEVHVVSVVVQMGEFVGAGVTGLAAAPTIPLEDAYDALEARTGQLMSEWQSATQRTFSRLSVHVRSEVPAAEIAQLASDLEADLVVVGTHGRRGLRRLLLGSVAEGVVRLAHCPVLVVRPVETGATVPQIEPPCPHCLETRRESGGAELWCPQHRERHGQRHTYHYESRVSADGTQPLFIPER
jgi:nucleotide-binding universal stress UspA family protein